MGETRSIKRKKPLSEAQLEQRRKACLNTPPGPGRGHKKPPPERREGDFDRLAVMRYVLNNPSVCDRTEGEKAMRAYLEKSPGQFMETYDDLVRREEEAKLADDNDEAPVDRTEQDQELYRLLDELISRAGGLDARPHQQ